LSLSPNEKEFPTLTKHVVTLCWTDENGPQITAIVLMAESKDAAVREVLMNWPAGETIGAIVHTAQEYAAQALQFRDDIQPDPPWKRVSLN
jgi:hypothetical protein